MSSLSSLRVEKDPPSPHLPRILVVDDDVFVVRLISRTLDQMAQVIGALNGQDGLRLAVSERPDLIILDYVLPDILGDDVCRRMRRHDVLDGSKIVFLTAHGRFLSEKDVLADGADALLVKPFSPLALLNLTTSLLAR